MDATPFVTIIMPIRNEAAHIEHSLSAVLAQDYPQNRYEVIVADGRSTDSTREIVRAFQTSNQNVRLIDNPGGIVPTGINLALRQAKGEIIIRVDGHCEIAPDYVRRCVGYLMQEDIDCVGGPMEAIGETYVSQVIAIAMSSTFGVGGSAFRTIRERRLFVETVAFPGYTRHAIRKTGWFDEELVRNQDDEYNYRLRRLGGKILLSPDIHSRYYSRSSLSSLWRQFFQYGYWKVRVLQKHPRQMRLRQFVPPIFVWALLTSFIFSLFSPIGRACLVLLTGMYAIANLSASLWTVHSRGWRYLPILPVIYAILHISYGLGFLVGLVKFAHRWGDKVGKVPVFQRSDL